MTRYFCSFCPAYSETREGHHRHEAEHQGKIERALSEARCLPRSVEQPLMPAPCSTGSNCTEAVTRQGATR